MKVTTFDESIAHDIGHAFGYYDYGEEHGLVDAFPSRDAVAEYIGGYVRMTFAGGMLYTTSERDISRTSCRDKSSVLKLCFLWLRRFSGAWISAPSSVL